MDPPAPETLMRALEQLNYLGAQDDEGDITEKGRKMSEIPLDPVLAKVVLASSMTYNCVNEALAIVALLNVPNIFVRPKDQASQSDAAKAKFQHNDGDHLTLLNVFNQYKKNGGDVDWCWKNYLNSRALKQACDIRE